MTVEEFLNDLLEVDASTAITVSHFESALRKVVPVEAWKAGKVIFNTSVYISVKVLRLIFFLMPTSHLTFVLIFVDIHLIGFR